MTLCSIDTVAFGGEGIARVDTLAVFVPLTLPEEQVEIQIEQRKKNFAKASLKKIITPSRDRIVPPCPYFGTCGGCTLQHASYLLQLELKRRFIKDSLTRIGRIDFPVPPVSPSSDPFGYRRHITLKLKQENSQFRLGFTSLERSHLPIQSCLLFDASKTPLLPLLQDIFAGLNSLLLLSDSSIKMIKQPEHKYLVVCNFLAFLPPEDLAYLKKSFEEIPSLSGWIIKTPKQLFEFGETKPYFIHNDLIFHFSPFGFVQNHPEQSGRIYDWIVEKNTLSQKVLDLYSGVGASSLLLAQKGKQVLGIELNPLSTSLSIQNGKENQIEGVQFLCGSAERSTKKALLSFKPDALVINPPKAGIDSMILKELVNSSCRSITYISCNPTTLARDLSFLIKQGFMLEELQAFDMFPQTTHVETVVQLVRNLR